MKVLLKISGSMAILAFIVVYTVIKYQFYRYSPSNPVNVIRNHFYKRETAKSELSPNPNLIELSGQSNATGMAATVNLPANLKYPAKSELIYNAKAKQFEQIEPGINNSGNLENSIISNHFGVELRLMNLLVSHFHQNQYLIKSSVNNTSLRSLTLRPDWSSNSINEYFDFSNERHFEALKALHDDHPPAAFIWIQGESDCFEDMAYYYKASLQQFIYEKRRTYGYPNMPFIIARLGNLQSMMDRRYYAVVRAAQEEVSTEPNNYLVNADGLAVVDEVHYTAAGYDTIALRIFNQIVKIRAH